MTHKRASWLRYDVIVTDSVIYVDLTCEKPVETLAQSEF